MHVLRINVLQRGVSFTPLMHSLANRTNLTALAANHPNLVAATNSGYFDFFAGAPTDPLIVKGLPLVLSANHQMVAGIASNGYGQSGHVWLNAELVAGKKKHSVQGVNELHESSGLEIFSKAWGSERLPGVRGGGGGFGGLGGRGGQVNARPVLGGKLGAAQHGADTVPSGGYMLVGRNSAATSWLSSIPTGTKISLTFSVKTDAPRPFVQAYGVGAAYVQRSGVVRTNLSCNSANTTQPARTSIGFADNGKTLVLAEVEDHPGTTQHGLDEDQMSKFMVQLGVQRAFAWDGSGSTELLAKLAGKSGLSKRTYSADGQERPMPVGFGVLYHKPKVKKKH
jgi:hypothetical protein